MENVVVLAFVSVHFLFMLTPLGFGQGDTLSLCNRTPYPEICSSFISTEPKENIDETLLTFRESALKATMALAEQAHKLISDMDVNLLDESARSAWYDCMDLYGDTLNHLNRSIFSSSGMADVQSWLNAAMTNTEACENGFTNLLSFPLMLSNFTKLLSNSLAINVATVSTPARDPIFSEQHVNPDFPNWISSRDRKLLRIRPGKLGRGRKQAADVVVAQDGSGTYRTITEALEASEGLTRNGRGRFIIYVKQGVYMENVVIADSMNNYTFIGDGIDATIVTGSRNTKDGYKTFDSATFSKFFLKFFSSEINFFFFFFFNRLCVERLYMDLRILLHGNTHVLLCLLTKMMCEIRLFILI